jgi:hypothetical protein
MPYTKYFTFLLFVLTVSVDCQADIMFEIVSGPSVSASSSQSVASGISVTTFTRGFGLSPAGASSTFNSDDFTVSGIEANAVTNGDFITWGFASATPYDLTDFDIRYDRSANGPTGIRIDFQANGGVFQTVWSDATVNENGETIIGTSLASFSNVSTGTFRLLGFGATASNGTFDFENAAAISSPNSSFQLNGTPTAAVPEPASFACLGVLVLGGMACSRFRKKFSLNHQ